MRARLSNNKGSHREVPKIVLEEVLEEILGKLPGDALECVMEEALGEVVEEI